LWYPVRFQHENDVRLVFTCSCLLEVSRFIDVICVCLRTGTVFTPVWGAVYGAHLVIILCCFYCGFVCLRPVSCVSRAASVSGLSILYCPFCFLLHCISYKICNTPVKCFLLCNNRRDASYRLNTEIFMYRYKITITNSHIK
jgi:hypothetical protein